MSQLIGLSSCISFCCFISDSRVLFVIEISCKWCEMTGIEEFWAIKVFLVPIWYLEFLGKTIRLLDPELLCKVQHGVRY